VKKEVTHDAPDKGEKSESKNYWHDYCVEDTDYASIICAITNELGKGHIIS